MKNYEIVQSEYGPIKGVHKSSAIGYNYISFQGIPYMKPPLGKLRFKEPQSPEKWEKVLDATGKASSYVIMNQVTNFCEGQEDAGIINVYTKDVEAEKLFPVMVFVSDLLILN
jgi:carboxylesterase type B